MTYIALLRGINVSGQKKIKMADLREALSQLSFSNIRTYIQSGNILFDSEEENIRELETQIHDKIQAAFGFDVPVLVIRPELLHRIMKENPFLDQGKETNKLYVTFLAEKPETDQIKLLESVDYSPEEFILEDSFLYFYFPNGYGRTKLNNNFFEKKLKVKATTRNWKTINKLYELATNPD
ncbi:MAG: DUF1697 domain-containing protein [Saprospiraceae bacterium]|nr:DUF1697 domain-containing protein [Saprospiraceae bacterium]